MSKRPSTADRDRPVTEESDGDAFLSRWARRKRIARDGADPDEAAPSVRSSPTEAPAADTPAAGESVAGETAAPGDEDMPPLEAIDEHTDMSGFFSSKVSRAVKQAALRKFFHSPAFNVVDGLDDYDDDFRSFAALGDVVTSDMRGVMEREAEQAREKPPGNAAPAAPATAQADSVAEPVAITEDDGGPADQTDGDAPVAKDADLAVAQDDTRGVIREPGRPAPIRHGKLRPRRDRSEDA